MVRRARGTLIRIKRADGRVRLVDRIRASLQDGTFDALREETTGAYYGEPR